jgi:hypothetical protein
MGELLIVLIGVAGWLLLVIWAGEHDHRARVDAHQMEMDSWGRKLDAEMRRDARVWDQK